MKHLATYIASVTLLLCGAASAQEFQHFSASLGAGFTTPVGTAGSSLDNGWNIDGAVGVNFAAPVGVMLDLGYNRLGIDNSVLNGLGFGSGGLHIFSATLDPIIHLNPHGHLDLYVIGGGGIYHQFEQVMQPSGISVMPNNTFLGFSPSPVPVQEVATSYSVNKPGIDAGMGIALGTKWHGKIFAEARWNRIFMRYTHTDYIPVTFGFRW